MAARRKAAGGDFLRQDAPFFGVGPHKAQRFAELAEGLAVPGLFPYAVGQDGGVIPCRCKLQRHRVALPGADVFVSPAGHHDHHGTAQSVRHPGRSFAQIHSQRSAAAKRQLFHTHRVSPSRPSTQRLCLAHYTPFPPGSKDSVPVTTPCDRLCFSVRKKPSSRPARFCSLVTPPVTLLVTHWLTGKTRMNPSFFGFCDHVTCFYKKKETAKGACRNAGKVFCPRSQVSVTPGAHGRQI